jgi:fructose transport system substrate-binding protein
MTRRGRLALSLAIVMSGACAREDARPVIGLITKTESNPFFVSMKDGAERAATADGFRLLTAGGKSDGDNASQVTALENMVAAGAKTIMITVNDSKAIVPAIAKARAQGVMVIALDSPADPIEATDGLFATDNYLAGELIGQYARASLGTRAPRIATIDLLPGHPVGAQRHNGFLQGFGLVTNPRTSNELAQPPEVVCMVDSYGDRAKGQTGMENCLQKNPEINVVYTINEPSAAGAYNALEKAGKASGVVIVSVDGGCDGIKAIQAGHLGATAQQYPSTMAELGVRAARAFASTHVKASGYTDTGVRLITARPLAGLPSLSADSALAVCWGAR